MAQRIKTPYPGVYYREEPRLGANSRTEKVYYIRYRQGGRDSKLIEEKVGRETEQITAAKANHIRALRARGAESTNKERRTKVEEARQAYLSRPLISRLWEAYDENNPERSSRDSDSARYKLHIAPYCGKKAPEDLRTLDIDKIRRDKLKTLSPQTVKHILSLLRRIINFGVKKGLCPMPDASKLNFEFPSVDNEKTECLTAEQLTRYLSALDEEFDQDAAALLRLALVTGMRKGALLALRWDDVDFERGFITLRGESAKNNRTERIPMPEPARVVLEYIERTGSPFIFPGKDGRKRQDFRRMAKRIKEKAGLPADFRPLHGLRHTFASLLASSGTVDRFALQKLLTHRSPQMTQRYAHLTDESLLRAAATTGEIFQEVGNIGSPELEND